MQLELVMVAIGVMLLLVVGILVIVAKSWRRVPEGKALIISKAGTESRVLFEGGTIVIPIVNAADAIDTSVKTLKVACRRAVCADDERVDIDATFFVRINRTADDVLRVAQSIGATRASDPAAVEALFMPKFTEAVLTVVAKLERGQLQRQRDQIKDEVIMVVGRDLSGFVLDDVTIDRIEAAGYIAHDPEGRGRVERAGSDDVAKLARDVARLEQQVARLTEQLVAAKLITAG